MRTVLDTALRVSSRKKQTLGNQSLRRFEKAQTGL